MKQTLLLLCFSVIALPSSAIEIGDNCEKIKTMPEGLICWQDSTFDCDKQLLQRNLSLLCTDAEFRREDKKLNTTYQRILKLFDSDGDGTFFSDPPRRKQELIESQRAWVSFRIADCRSEGHLNGGDWDDVFIVGCEIQATKQRIRILSKRFLKN